MKRWSFAALLACGCAASTEAADVVTVPVVAVSASKTELAQVRPARIARPQEDGEASKLDACVADARMAIEIGRGADPSEPTYRTALDEEAKGRLDQARKLYLSVVQDAKSALVPYAYFAFGVMFEAESASDPSKLGFAEQAYQETAKYPDAPIAAFALYGQARVDRKSGSGEKALSLLAKTIAWTSSHEQSSCNSTLRAASMRDIATVYADFGDPRKAFSFFKALGGADDATAADLVAKLAERLDAKGKTEDAQRAAIAGCSSRVITPALCSIGRVLSDKKPSATRTELASKLSVCP